ncbi:hypothetical protein CEUSTIGMA_g12993.t1 [Chlamydomonas eustigma]|uniref:Uncharacterized protein n=1 Tax=Chlamydomonas eustigma TaxID=1157962 RepID=A0A250XR92_9CHLO|nr:hypothetical protein CEUSTIGMA_g12993.t1 [Chlamydomonas eustigma]|eukprot:GAX85578.1 hypothetical protein CEUSTIGMA_g12993.t1 [Chlamydomonas eustigma]
MEDHSSGGGTGGGLYRGQGAELWRAKVYKLNGEGSWIDRGTGMICCDWLEQAGSHGLVVISEEEENKTLLVHKISKEDIYQRSGESTIINWHDPDISSDIAVSFQEQSGCDYIWHQIKQVQQDYLDPESQSRPRPLVDEYEQQQAKNHFEEAEGGLELPPAEISKLDDIAKALSCTTPFQRERAAAALMKNGYIASLLDIFRQCEDLEDNASLAHMYRIMKAAIMLNDAALLDELLKEEHVMDVVGTLEYDPEFKTHQKHREFLQRQVQFREVVPISDTAVIAKIHQTYRIQYIKDVILPRSLDDATYTTLSSIALFNNVEVVTALQSDSSFLSELFLRLAKYTCDDAEWGDLIAFLQEFCGLARHLQQPQRLQLFKRLSQLGLFNEITRIMKVSPDAVKLKATDVLLSVTQHDVGSLRDFLLHQSDHMLFGLLVRELTEGGDESGLPEQISELLKALLDPETMDTAVEKNDFLELFYDTYVNKLLQVIVLDKTINSDGLRYVPPAVLSLIVDLFCFFVQHHAYRVKYYLLRSHMIEKVLKVVRRRERWLACAGVRFLRTCITVKDEFFTRYLVKHNSFEPIMTVFFENGDRYNLLNSAVLDVIDFVRRENIKVLIDYLVDHFGHRFDDIEYVDTLKTIKLKYEQMHERSEGGEMLSDMGNGVSDDKAGSSAQAAAPLSGRTFSFSASGELMGGRRKRKDERGLDQNEEDYFSSDRDEDEESQDQGTTNSGPLPPPSSRDPTPASASLRQGTVLQLTSPTPSRPGAPLLGRGNTSGGRGRGRSGVQSPPLPAEGLPSSNKAAESKEPKESTSSWRLVEYEDEEEEIAAPSESLSGGGNDRGDLGRRPHPSASMLPSEASRKVIKVQAGDSPAREKGSAEDQAGG